MEFIFASDFFMRVLLPFLLVFVIVFAVLQKSKLLGDSRAQVDALVALVFGLIVTAFSYQTDVIVNLVAWAAVGLAVILVFFLLYGFVAGDLSSSPTWMKVVFGILAGLFVIGVMVYITGLWEYFDTWFFGSEGLWLNIIMLVVVVGAVAIVLFTGKSGGSSG